MEIAHFRVLRYSMAVTESLLPLAERRIFRPAQLNALAKDLLESNFHQIWLEGEVSNLSKPASGHLYFTLKDTHAQIRCAMFRNRALYLTVPLKDGQQILVRARLTLYEARGDYQLSVESAEPAGQGALQLAFEQLKAKLDAEGLFSASNKRPLPPLLKRLALITSPRGAAVHDVLTVLGRRFPLLPVELWPVPVQGADAAAEILASLSAALASQRYDAILITRGGGALEDLWPFNDEALVRRVVEAAVPVVSAVGHEVDFTLLDFAADLRAATPSAAAELLVPHRTELLERLQQQRRKLDQLMRGVLQNAAQRCDRAQLQLQAKQPAQRLHNGKLQLQTLLARLHGGMQRQLEQRVTRLRQSAHRLSRVDPAQTLPVLASHLNTQQRALHHAMQRLLENRLLRLKHAGSGLNALSPLATLQRGYSILRDEQHGIISSRASTHSGQRLQAQLADGTLNLKVEPDAD